MPKPTVLPWATFLRASGAGQFLDGNGGGRGHWNRHDGFCGSRRQVVKLFYQLKTIDLVR
jgi:hypothetical protein